MTETKTKAEHDEDWANHQDWVGFNYGCRCSCCVTWAATLPTNYQPIAVDDDRPRWLSPPHVRPRA
jgi:hypothetical protein